MPLVLTWANPDSEFEPDPKGGIFCLRGFVDETLVGDIVVPYFQVTIPNPGSFIQSSRYATLTYVAPNGTSTTLAKGRMTSLPVDMGGDTVDVEFTCVPPNSDTVLKASADASRRGENPAYSPGTSTIGWDQYDPLFFTAESSDDPFSAIVARPEIFAWNRTSNTLSLRSLVSFQNDHVISSSKAFEGSLKVSVLDPPKKVTKTRLVAAWTQEAKGIQMRQVSGSSVMVRTYSFDDFINSFPKAGTPIGADTGWYLAEADIQAFERDMTFDTFPVDIDAYTNNDGEVEACELMLSAATVTCNLRLGYDYQQQREEVIDITLPASIQKILDDDVTEMTQVIQLGALNEDLETPKWGEDDPETEAPRVYKSGDKVQANGRVWFCMNAPPNSDVFRVKENVQNEFGVWNWVTYWVQTDKVAAMPLTYRDMFFDTSRGERAIRHAILRMAKQIIRRAMCVQISFEVPFDEAVNMRVGDSASITHRKLSKGHAKGWISSVRLVVDGANRRATVTMLSSIGNGGGSTAVPNYEITAPDPVAPVDVDGLATKLPKFNVLNDYFAQKAAANVSTADPVGEIQKIPTQIELGVAPLVEEDIYRRRMKVECNALPLRMDYDI